MSPTRYKLKIRSLKFLSAVDFPAQSEVANALLLKRAGGAGEVTLTAQVAKVNDELGLVFGYAFASSLDGGESPYVDLQQDAIDPDFLKAAMDWVQNGGATDVNHDDQQDGRVVFAWPLLPDINKALGIDAKVQGLAVAIKPSAATFARYKSGELRGFSIAGMGEREPLEKAASTSEAIEKAVAKAATERQIAYQAFDIQLANFAKEAGKDPRRATSDFLATPIGAELYKAYSNAANEYAFEAPTAVDPTVARLKADLAAKQSAIAQMEEDFCLRFNATPTDAQARLPQISSSYRAAVAAASQTARALSDAIAHVEHVWRAHVSNSTFQTNKSRHEEMQKAADAAAAAAEAALPPTLKAFNAARDAFAKAQNLTPAAATSPFLHTQEGARLYQEYSTEQGIGGVR